MGRYRIKDFEALSGIKAHTIRIWERRYGILNPSRSHTNIREYNNDDLRFLLNISLLNRNGFKISMLAKMKREDIDDRVRTITASNHKYSNQVNALTLCMVDWNETEFERIMNMNIAHIGFEQTMEQVIFPFLRNIGIMWQTGSVNPSEEHFVSNLIRHKLIVAIESIKIRRSNYITKSLLYLPEDEMHEVALLYLWYLLRKKHHRVLYLGQNVPFRDLQVAAKSFKPHQVFSIFTSYPHLQTIDAYLGRLSAMMPEGHIYLSGFLMWKNKLKIPSNIYVVKEICDFRSLINDKIGIKTSEREKKDV